jgi:predicted phosphoribosyltransferase
MASFYDRHDAGARLAGALERYAGDPDAIVLALPRGGVPVGYEIASRLHIPLDVIVVRKIGVPGRSELAMGAIASGDVRVVDERITQALGIPDEEFDAVVAREQRELVRRESAFRGDRPPLDVRGKTAIVVDDGLATGSSMKAAVDAVRLRGPARVIGAVPVAPPDTCEELAHRADDMICLVMPEHMYAVGMAYDDFDQTSDTEVRELLDRAARELSRASAAQHATAAQP